MDYNKLFKDFIGRDEMLKKVTRYSLYKTMYYRTDLVIHQKRVYWLTKELMPYFKKAFGNNLDEDRLLIMALIHDDPEIIFGDYQAGTKAKMSDAELNELDNLELEAINEISHGFPEKIGCYNYRDILVENLEVKSIEAQIRKFTDKLDGYGEALHEIFAGNLSWVVNPINEYGVIETNPQFYVRTFKEYPIRYPLMKNFYKSGFPLYGKIKMFDYQTVAKNGSLPTLDSLKKDLGYYPYDFWKETMLKYSRSDDLEYLYIQREFN